MAGRRPYTRPQLLGVVSKALAVSDAVHSVAVMREVELWNRRHRPAWYSFP
jgi:hypothetical protein